VRGTFAMTANEAGQLIGMPAQTIRRMLQSGELMGHATRPMRVSVCSFARVFGAEEESVRQSLRELRDLPAYSGDWWSQPSNGPAGGQQTPAASTSEHGQMRSSSSHSRGSAAKDGRRRCKAPATIDDLDNPETKAKVLAVIGEAKRRREGFADAAAAR
jgi:hypothetical protein